MDTLLWKGVALLAGCKSRLLGPSMDITVLDRTCSGLARERSGVSKEVDRARGQRVSVKTDDRQSFCNVVFPGQFWARSEVYRTSQVLLVQNLVDRAPLPRILNFLMTQAACVRRDVASPCDEVKRNSQGTDPRTGEALPGLSGHEARRSRAKNRVSFQVLPWATPL